MQTIGQSFANPYRAIQTAESANSRANYSDARRSQLPKIMQLREQAQSMRQKMMDQRMQSMKFNQGMRMQQFGLQQQSLQERIREFDERQKSGAGDGLTPAQEARLRYTSGMPVRVPLSNGKMGAVQAPSGVQKSQLQSVLTAVPQAIPLLKSMMNGAQYTMNSGGNLKKYFSSLRAYMQNPDKVSASDQKVLSEAGLNKTALVSLVETTTRLMNLAKTNETAQMMMGQLSPQKGQTPQSYFQQLKFLNNDYLKRYYQAQYQDGIGFPVYLGNQDETNNVSSDMRSYIQKQIGRNEFDFPGSADGASKTDSSSDAPTEDEISDTMSQFPDLGRAKAIAMLLKLKGAAQ